MAKEITMPKLSDTMTEGLFAGWRKNVGDRIERGDIIAEVETDKAVMELEAFASGVLLKTFVQGGEQIPVGTVLGLIGEIGELIETAPAAPLQAAAVETPVSAPLAAPALEPTVTTEEAVHEEQRYGKASPMVRRLAREQGIDLDQIQGTGPDGRITQDDLAGLHVLRPPETVSLQMTSVIAAASGLTAEAVAPSSMRQAIANAVSQSWSTIPHFTVTVEICMEACREIVSELKAGDRHVGYNALIIKGCARTLERFPLLLPSTVSASDGINISIAVALPDGLLMPVIKQCQKLTLNEIELETARLVGKSREGRLTSGEMSGGHFSLSNLGMYGVDEFAALIMPGQVAILAVGAVTDRALVRDGQLVAAPTMRVTLSSDHRIIDGSYAASFLADLRTALEQPVPLLLG